MFNFLELFEQVSLFLVVHNGAGTVWRLVQIQCEGVKFGVGKLVKLEEDLPGCRVELVIRLGLLDLAHNKVLPRVCEFYGLLLGGVVEHQCAQTCCMEKGLLRL